MARTRIKLKELRNATVSYISLVDRAATRIPFRVTKADKEPHMIDLSARRLLSALKGESTPIPRITALITPDTDAAGLAATSKALVEAGFLVDTVIKNDDGTYLFAQEKNPLEASEVFRMSENMLVVVKGFDEIMPMLKDNLGFAPDMEALPGIQDAVAGLHSKVVGGMTMATKSEDVAGVSEVLTQFNNYMSALVANLNPSAFKADAALAALADVQVQKGGNNTLLDIEALVKAAPLGSDGTEWSAMSTVGKIKWLLASYTKKKDADGDECPAGTKPEDWAKLTPEEKAKAKATKSEAPAVDFTAVLAPLTDMVTALTVKVDTLATAQESLATQVDESARKSETAAQAVKSLVLAPSGNPDTPAATHTAKKQEPDDPRTGCFDTAFIKRGKR